MRDCKVRSCWLGVKPSDSCDQIGLPKDVLGGDPTGHLFDWVNSAFFFSYVSPPTQDHTSYPQTPSLDHLPNSCYCYFQTLPPAYLDGVCGFGMGTLFDANGVYMSNLIVSGLYSHKYIYPKVYKLRSRRNHRSSNWNGCIRSRM